MQLRIRKNNSKVNLIAVYDNTISKEQLEAICACVPKQNKIILAFDTNIIPLEIEKEVEKLKQKGYKRIEKAEVPSKYVNFFEIKDSNALLELAMVNLSLKIIL